MKLDPINTFEFRLKVVMEREIGIIKKIFG